MTIRRATVADIPLLMDLARAFVLESKHLRPLNEEHFAASWAQLVESGMSVLLLMFDNAGKAVGTIGGARWPDPLSGAMIATEYHWYVYPEHRGWGLQLYRVFEDWARENGCVEVQMAHLSDSMPERVAKFYRRQGFTPVETRFVKQLEAA